MASTQNNPHGQYRVEFSFKETGLSSVYARFNGDKEVVPYILSTKSPKSYTITIYNSEGNIDCRPPGTAYRSTLTLC